MNVEKRSIDFIPETERHGEPRSLFFVWFGANANITTVAAGVLPVSLGLNLFWSALSILLGSLIGAVFMASHSAQGPRLGIPQMIQSRAQFGVFGAIVPLLFVMLIYLGFFVSNTLLATQAVAASSPLSSEANIVLLGLLCFLVALFGYKLIHRLQKMLSLVSVVFFGIATLFALALPIDAQQWTTQGFNLASFLASVSIAVTWQLSYAPYVADYSRYLPTHTSARQVFWYSYTGTVIGGSWMMLLGAILTKGVTGFSDNVGLHLLSVLGGGSLLAVAFVLYGQIAINVFNLYGAFMSTVTVIEPFAALKVTAKVGELDRYRGVPRDHRARNSIHEYFPLRRPHRLRPARDRFGVDCWSAVSSMRLLRINEPARSRGDQANKSMIFEREIAQIKTLIRLR